MPQATDELRDKMRTHFGSMDTHGPQKYLEDKGYKLTKDWRWQKPDPLAATPLFELDCIDFLIEEWDYGCFANG
jgi:hypothetical protein